MTTTFALEEGDSMARLGRMVVGVLTFGFFLLGSWIPRSHAQWGIVGRELGAAARIAAKEEGLAFRSVAKEVGAAERAAVREESSAARYGVRENYQNGMQGEKRAVEYYRSAEREPHFLPREYRGAHPIDPDQSRSFWTPHGTRRLDSLTPDGMAIESKVGRTSASKRILDEVEKDLWLWRNGSKVEGVEWWFRRSPKTGKIGPSSRLLERLESAGIKVRYIDAF
jgi:hypothetical protein